LIFAAARISISHGSDQTGYDQAGHLLGEYSGTGTLVQETVWLGDIPVATLRPSGTSVAIYYVETDPLDTPTAVIVPSNNAVRWDWYTSPFGSAGPAIDPQNLGNFTYDLRFPGQIGGTWGSTFQNDNRDYEPAVGGYVESDPIGLHGGSYSTYAYVGGNPISNYDPDGLQEVLPTPAGVIVLPPLPGSTSQQWNQSRDAAAIALQDAVSNAISSPDDLPLDNVLALINAANAAGQAVHNLFCPNSSKDKENDCTKEKEECSEQCAEAMTDPDLRHVYGGSMTQCIKNCLPERCGGEPLWKGYKK
jgi:RHS repeat-associated protein